MEEVFNKLNYAEWDAPRCKDLIGIDILRKPLSEQKRILKIIAIFLLSVTISLFMSLVKHLMLYIHRSQ